jgi:cytoskeletal protein RodZ
MIYKNKIQQKRKKKLYLVIGLILLCVIAIVTILELTDTTTLFHKKNNAPHTSNQFTKGEGEQTAQQQSKSSDDNQPTNGDNTSKDTKGQSDTPVTPETELLTPTGNFVSAHKFSLVSNPPIGSTCETTPKATCQITFTSGSKTVQLDRQTTDDGGASYWTWKPKDIGLTTGTWSVHAKAQIGSQSKTADDALNLEITP